MASNKIVRILTMLLLGLFSSTSYAEGKEFPSSPLSKGIISILTESEKQFFTSVGLLKNGNLVNRNAIGLIREAIALELCVSGDNKWCLDVYDPSLLKLESHRIRYLMTMKLAEYCEEHRVLQACISAIDVAKGGLGVRINSDSPDSKFMKLMKPIGEDKYEYNSKGIRVEDYELIDKCIKGKWDSCKVAL
jgi:hypothetical protein